ncbi:hypothetical protein HOLleu_16272 [Holothuria leucospilota]|uniref:Peptidase aspartic putative domain-containing protein n=1 Tax=Holothuria leucospilota TaxID=206669 RepID=A0A9Q1H7P6_HOLLE|nr:hypothetical protein HOLleu_16272 [Holothuria leucospilota]
MIAFCTVPVILKNNGRRIKVNALLDDASTSTFVNADVAAELGLRGKLEKTQVHVLNDQIETFETMPVEVGLESLERQVDVNIRARTTERVTGDLLTVDWNTMASKMEHLKGIKFPKFSKRVTVDLLIGLDQIDLHYSMRDVCGKPGEPVARLARLGWTCIGCPVKEKDAKSHTNFMRTYFTHHNDVMAELNSTMRQFWETETLGTTPKALKLNSKEQAVIAKVKSTLVYKNGRYQVGVQWKGECNDLPDNKEMAIKRLENTERRLISNPVLGQAYSDVLNKYIEKGFIQKTETSESNSEGGKWYLPHFPVVRTDKTTTKTRVVFDASAKVQGTSLNDKIYQGPKLQRELSDVLIRFRKDPVAVVCDVEEMYLQIHLHLETDLFIDSCGVILIRP